MLAAAGATSVICRCGGMEKGVNRIKKPQQTWSTLVFKMSRINILNMPSSYTFQEDKHLSLTSILVYSYVVLSYQQLIYFIA